MVIIPDMENIPDCHYCPCYKEADMMGPAYCRMKAYLYDEYWVHSDEKLHPCPMKEVSVD